MTRDVIVNLSSNGVYWQADWKDANGKRLKKSLGPKSDLSARQARKKCQSLANELNRRGAVSKPGKLPSLGCYIDRYIESRTDVKPPTRYLFELTGRYLKTFFGEGKSIGAITRQGARDWRDALARGDFSEGRAMAEVSVCHRCADAKTMFKRAVEDDILSVNPFDRLKVKAPKPDKDWHYVSRSDLGKLIYACPSYGWKALIALCRLAGLRRGEALELPWSAIDWNCHRMTVFATKTGLKRLVPIDPDLLVVLHDVLRQSIPNQLRVCDVSRHCLWRNFTVIRKRAGLPAWKDAFQVMRRNCETDWAQLFPQFVVSEWIGHDMSVSATHYLKVPGELFDKAAGLQSAVISAP